jgi:hypothetical protein
VTIADRPEPDDEYDARCVQPRGDWELQARTYPEEELARQAGSWEYCGLWRRVCWDELARRGFGEAWSVETTITPR